MRLRLRLSDESVATLLEWIRLAGGLPIPRAIWSLFLASVALTAFGIKPSGFPWEDPIAWAPPWLFFFIFLRRLAERAGVLGMRDPVPGAQ